MANECIIRRMTMADVDGVAAVEAATFPTPWSRDAFASEMNNVAARYLVAELDGEIIGFAGAWLILDESHITNIAVLAAHRGQKIGRRLTEGLMQYLSNLGAAYVTLEVRKYSNGCFSLLFMASSSILAFMCSCSPFSSLITTLNTK